jgi:Kef-type K+ transport system membrane component KefB
MAAAERTAAGPATTEREVRRRPGTRRVRLLAVYAALVVVPVAGSVAVLHANGRGHTVAGEPPVDTLPRLLLAVVVIVTTAKLLGLAARRLGQPPVVGEICAGLVLGPSVLGGLWPDVTRALLPPAVLPQVSTLAEIGVVLFVFLAGLRVQTHLLRSQRTLAVVVSHVSIAFPFLLGVGLAVLAHRRFAPAEVGLTPFALFLGVSMSITALPVLARILWDTGLFDSPVGTLALTCAVVGDVTAWMLLALVIALVAGGSAGGVLVTLGLTAALVAALWFGVRPLLARVDTARDKRLVPLALVGLLMCALATASIGVHAVFGAFVFGLIVPRDPVLADRLEAAVGGLTMTVLLPLFFALTGLRTDLGGFGGDGVLWLWCGVVMVVAFAGKFVGSMVAARAAGVRWPVAIQVGALMNCRGLTELIVLNIGLELGVLSGELFTMLVIMALVSTVLAPLVVTRAARRL